ncbi:hypothetical protein D9756_010667 [Leucocoprinus leucothites]|uniref:Nephrocystin 3-like N-terminal domain-containing protein n=1 Tax=Leucocoprinus leucothites TaxID=201217 RepID=A0A8H5FT15_9AGAR|nr:hypothetical protein D9756_010667 [Leucoagaricus leucothites]
MSRHSRKFLAEPSRYSDQATDYTRSELPEPRYLPPQRSTLPSSFHTPLYLQRPSMLARPDIPTPAILPPSTTSVSPLRDPSLLFESANPMLVTLQPTFTPPPMLLDPETLNLAPRTRSRAILPPTSSSTPPPRFWGMGCSTMHKTLISAILDSLTPPLRDLVSFAVSSNWTADLMWWIGLAQLLKYSMPDAFYNSSARYPPPKCHLGTRKEYITLITKWVLGVSDRKEPILWMRGPFGVGKSAVAQSCAEVLAPVNKLAATLFFSGSNEDRDDPRRVFTSIAYQIATKFPSFREIIDKHMVEDPALATTSLSTQFEDLLIHPLREAATAGSGLEGRVVIIDGLDECRGTAEQSEIVRIIATSAHNRTTPFRWFITSRPEDPIIRTMNSPAVSPVRSRVELPVSRQIDHEILLFLTDEFEKIREDHSLPESWPPDEALALLVERGAGLWVYIAIMVRFIKDENSYGPKDQLRIVLEFAKDVFGKAGVDNPLAEMDFFYILIMQRIPLKLRPTVQKILLAHSTAQLNPKMIANALCLSKEQLRCACASIQSVMEFRGSDIYFMDINFYHASFLDFMKDPQRSKELCIHGDFLIGWRRELLGWLREVCSHSTDSSHIVFPSDTILLEGVSSVNHYVLILSWFWKLCGVPKHPLDFQTALALAGLPFGKMLRLMGHNGGWLVDAHSIRANLPAEFHDKIIWEANCPIPGCTNTKNVWILGHGENKSVPRQWKVGFQLAKNEDPPDGICVCQVEFPW